MELFEKTLESELVFDGAVCHLYKDKVELPDGSTSMREYIKHLGAVCVIPITDEGEVILEKQYRYSVGRVMIEIPAGKLDYAGEDFLSAAERELREETGAVAAEMIDMGDYFGSPAIMGEHIRMYMAKGLTFGECELDEGEFLEVERIPLEKAVEMVLSNELRDGKTQAAVLKVKLLRDKGLW